jgi:hypothetical protein
MTVSCDDIETIWSRWARRSVVSSILCGGFVWPDRNLRCCSLLLLRKGLQEQMREPHVTQVAESSKCRRVETG